MNNTYDDGFDEFECKVLACGIDNKAGKVLIVTDDGAKGWCDMSFVDGGEWNKDKMKTITKMTNNEVIENNLLFGEDGYVLSKNRSEIDRTIELGEQYHLACAIVQDSKKGKLTWM